MHSEVEGNIKDKVPLWLTDLQLGGASVGSRVYPLSFWLCWLCCGGKGTSFGGDWAAWGSLRFVGRGAAPVCRLSSWSLSCCSGDVGSWVFLGLSCRRHRPPPSCLLLLGFGFPRLLALGPQAPLSVHGFAAGYRCLVFVAPACRLSSWIRLFVVPLFVPLRWSGLVGRSVAARSSSLRGCLSLLR